jgi:hypothetical protein
MNPFVGIAIAQIENGALRNREYHVHGVLADEGCQSTAGRRDHIALGNADAADLTVDRSADFGIAEIDLSGLELILSALDLCRQGAFGSERRIVIRLWAGRLLEQVLGTRQRYLGVLMLGVELVYIGLGGIDLRLKRRLLKLIKEIAFFDFRAFDKQPLFKERRDSRDDGDSAHGLDPADEFIGLCYLLPLGPNDAYGGRACRLLCGSAVREPTTQCQQDKNCRKPLSHSMLRSTDLAAECSRLKPPASESVLIAAAPFAAFYLFSLIGKADPETD